jgi:hypothetical protein
VRTCTCVRVRSRSSETIFGLLLCFYCSCSTSIFPECQCGIATFHTLLLFDFASLHIALIDDLMLSLLIAPALAPAVRLGACARCALALALL